MHASPCRRGVVDICSLLCWAVACHGVAAAGPGPSLRVGIIGLDTSHAPAFAKELNNPQADADLADCRVVAAYPQGSPDIESSVVRVPEYTRQLQALGVEIVDSIDGLLQRVDVILLETNDGRPHLEQVLPVLKAKKRVFIDKPLAGTLVDCLAIEEAAKIFQTPIFSSSSLRFAPSTIEVRGGKFGSIVGADAYSPCTLEPTHPDLFWYGVHGVETLFTALGSGCQSVVRVSAPDTDVVVGQWSGGQIGIFRGTRSGGGGYGGTAFTAQGVTPLGGYQGYRPLVVEIVKFFRTGQSPVDLGETIEIYAFMEAADESKRQGGTRVSLASVLARARSQVPARLSAMGVPVAAAPAPPAAQLQVASFAVDVTPPIGSPLCDGLVPAASHIDDPLSARGIILLPTEQAPIVLVAVDWVGIGNEGHDAWRKAIAASAGTAIDRVSVHALHQHDAPGCDFAADRIAAEVGLAGKEFDVAFATRAIGRVADEVRAAMQRAESVSHVGYGQAIVEQVASNRRLLGADGKVEHVRFTACRDPELRARPEGTIDPQAKVVAFFQDERPVATLSYYATHPQSYYGQGHVSADFVGMARSLCEQHVKLSIPQVHFNGAGGNIGAGKYNDGSPENRPVLAERLARGFVSAYRQAAAQRVPLDSHPLRWETRDVRLPLAEWFDEKSARQTMADKRLPDLERVRAARNLAWAQRIDRPITIGRLRIGPVDLLHLPGEAFVEYQLAAQQLRPRSLVCTAAYGDYGPGYIGLAHSYTEGGYETGPVSRVSPRAEQVLMQAISELMQ